MLLAFCVYNYANHKDNFYLIKHQDPEMRKYFLNKTDLNRNVLVVRLFMILRTISSQFYDQLV